MPRVFAHRQVGAGHSGAGLDKASRMLVDSTTGSHNDRNFVNLRERFGRHDL